MPDLQLATVLVLFAALLVAVLQTASMPKWKPLGIAASVLILAAAVFCLVRDWSVPERVAKLSPVLPEPEVHVTHQNADFSLRKFAREFKGFAKEMEGYEGAARQLSAEKAQSEVDKERLAGKALSLREKVGGFVQRLQKWRVPAEGAEFHKELCSAAEHLRLAAFALHAGFSSDDSAFSSMQVGQVLEQLELSAAKRRSAHEALSKLAPDF